MTTKLELTSLNTLKTYAQGQLVELPPFAEGQPFIARLRRPSLLVLAKAGKIPNELLTSASTLFSSKGSKDATSTDRVVQMNDMFDAICEASFVSPTYTELKEIGVELTDEQKMFVFTYAQNGVKALDSFRTERSDIITHSNGSLLQAETESGTEY